MGPRFVTRRSTIHGKGVFARVDLAAGELLMEYRGRRITREQATALDAALTRSGHTFLFTVNDNTLIDGSVGGNSARWMNHACEPNCLAQIHVNIDGDEARDRVLIETLRPVRAGEELTFDYGIVLAVPHFARLKRIWACRCGSPRCTGTLLKPRPGKPKTAGPAESRQHDRT